MAGDKSTVKVTYLGDATSLTRASKKAAEDVERVGKKSGQASGRLKGAAVAGAAAAGIALIGFAKSSISAYTDAQKSQAELENAYKRFPAVTDVPIQRLRDLNSALEKKTTFDDDAVASGQAVLAQFGLTGKQIEALTPQLLDYATRTGKDLPEAARDLGKAVDGQGRALKNIGGKFVDTHDKAKNFAQLQDILKSKVGGAAETMGGTAAGKAAILKNQFGELQEKVGEKLVPALSKAVDVGLKVVAWLQKNGAWLTPVLIGVGTIIGLVKAWTIAQAALNFVMSMNPIALVVIAIAALAAGLVYAYKHSETFRKIVDGAFKAIGDAASFMWNKVIKPVFKFWLDTWFTIVGALVNGAASAFGWVPGIGGKLKAAAKKFNEFRDQVNGALDGVHKDIHITAKLDGYVNPQNLSIGHRYASGTMSAASGMALVGEHGPEIVEMRGGERVYTASQTRSMRGGLTIGQLVVHAAPGDVGISALTRKLHNLAYTLGAVA